MDRAREDLAMSKMINGGLIGVLCCAMLACAPVMAAKQDGYVDVEAVYPGVHKRTVLATFGKPIQSYVNGREEKCDIFKFRQGYRTGTKVGRAVLHGAADFLTLGLWELVGTPLEAGLSGDDVSYEVCYDVNDRATTVIPLSKFDGKRQKPTVNSGLEEETMQ